MSAAEIFNIAGLLFDINRSRCIALANREDPTVDYQSCQTTSTPRWAVGFAKAPYNYNYWSISLIWPTNRLLVATCRFGHLSHASDQTPSILIASGKMISHSLGWWVLQRLPTTLMPDTLDVFLAILGDMGNQSPCGQLTDPHGYFWRIAQWVNGCVPSGQTLTILIISGHAISHSGGWQILSKLPVHV